MTEQLPGAHRRAVPQQPRAAATYQKILDASSRILAERGIQGLNTNLVAERAGVNVATVYHYFSDKNAILRELYAADQAVRDAYTAQRFEVLATAEDLEAWFADGIRVLMRLRRRSDISTTLRLACRATPELADLERQDSLMVARRLSPALRERFPGLSAARARMIAISIVETTTAMLDHASFDQSAEAGILRELTTIMSAYLHVLDETFGSKKPITAPSRKHQSAGRR